MLMDVYGIIIASSGKINFEYGRGVIYTLHNAIVDIYFPILILDDLTYKWNDILINHSYKFTDMKLGGIKMCNDIVQFVLKTTPQSSFFEVDTNKMKKIKLKKQIKALISIPSILCSFAYGVKEESCLISYEGTISKVISNGIYQLDEKVTFLTFFNASVFSVTSKMKPGVEIVISNAHFFTNHSMKILVCCGLSSITIIDQLSSLEDTRDINSTGINFALQYRLNIYDVLWIEELIMDLKCRFATLTDTKDISLNNNNFCENIINFFSSQYKLPFEGKISMVEEYFSHPHNCCAFSQGRLCTEVNVPLISEIISTAAEKCTRMEFSRKWNISIYSNTDMVMAGLLFMGKDGDFFITDGSYKLQVLFVEDCVECTQDGSSVVHFFNQFQCIMFLLAHYDIISERIYCKDGKMKHFVYLRTPFCHLFHLMGFKNEEIHSSDSKSELAPVPLINESQVPLNAWPEKDLINETLHGECDCQEYNVLVLSRLHFLYYENPSVFRFLVLFLPNKEEVLDTFETDDEGNCFNRTLNFYETDDDLEFADMMKKFNDLICLNSARLGEVYFESKHKRFLLLSNHCYTLKLRNSSLKDKTRAIRETMCIGLNKDSKIIYNGSHADSLYKSIYDGLHYCSIRYIVTHRQVPQNSIISGLVIEKFYEVSSGSTSKSIKKFHTLCLVLKDVISEDVIYAYVPISARCSLGFFPGSLVNLFGFSCACSQRGYLYLKALSKFSAALGNYEMSLKNIQSHPDNSSMKVDAEFLKESWFGKSERKNCFVKKIVSAKICAVCSVCDEDFNGNCYCLSTSRGKITVSALIDNGQQLFLMHCIDESARRILDLGDKEWCALSHYVLQNHGALHFSDKMTLKEVTYFSVMNQVFFTYCSSESLCRPLLLKYVPYIDRVKGDEVHNFAWITKVVDYRTEDIILNLCHELKENFIT